MVENEGEQKQIGILFVETQELVLDHFTLSRQK